MASKCIFTCKTLRPCYENMLNDLQKHDEAFCVEDAVIGISTISMYMQALTKYCGDVITVYSTHRTYEGRHLYEVVLNAGTLQDVSEKPIMLLDAGQNAGAGSTLLALYVIEQLVACEEYNEMINKVQWVILPCTNPDGLEYARFQHNQWKKNMRPSEDTLSYGVDITRNFDDQWNGCDHHGSTFSANYPGHSAASENETIFIADVIKKYKKNMKLYLSIRKDGHTLLYPYGYNKNNPPQNAPIVRIANDVAAKVNLRAGGVQVFTNSSIFDFHGKPFCGHSVDYAYDLGINLCYEMQVYHETDLSILSGFQVLPKGYQDSLRNGYFSGIKEFYHAVVKKYGKL